MVNRFLHKILVVLVLMSANLCVQAEELCMDGTLLFREDFGGNDPNDPVAGTDPAPGMTSSYTQIYDTATCNGRYPCTGMGGGRYLLTKVGYRNSRGYTYSHWFIMDDHTYPNDYTRGYLLEIDGRTDNATLFETVIDGLCEGSRLTFSAYVVNVTTSDSYNQGNNGDPQLSFVLTDPETGAELATPYKTGPIPVDRSYQGMPGEWRNSAHWQLVGMNFIVPAGKTAIKLLIKNACTASNGNDFAIDDIEIRLCAPPVTIEGETEVCDNEAITLNADFTNDGTFPEPLEYKWWHSEDSLTWTELSETSSSLSITAIQKADSGWYKVAVSGAGNIESVNCRAMSVPFKLSVKECVPPIPPCPELLTITADTTVCDTLMPFTWRGMLFDAPGSQTILLKDEQGCDSIEIDYTLSTFHCPYPPVSVSQDTTICDTLSQIKWHDKLFPITPEIHDTVYDAYGYDSVYCTLHITRYHCPYPPVTISSDTTICDTLAQIAWRDKIYAVTSVLRDTLYDAFGADSVYFVLNISTETCCPYMIREQEHHYICDTLMPYVWHGFGDSAVIEEEGEHIIEIPSKRWPDCIAYRITVLLNVEHCERLYPLIVNKYNWQLLLDNVTLRRLFPNRTATSYQWYKNEEPISGATEDDYAEQNELNGIFQLRVTLDGDQIIWSNILTISPSETEVPIEIKVYNWQNLYLIRYEQGDKVWTEKRLIP